MAYVTRCWEREVMQAKIHENKTYAQQVPEQRGDRDAILWRILQHFHQVIKEWLLHYILLFPTAVVNPLSFMLLRTESWLCFLQVLWSSSASFLLLLQGDTLQQSHSGAALLKWRHASLHIHPCGGMWLWANRLHQVCPQKAKLHTSVIKNNHIKCCRT